MKDEARVQDAVRTILDNIPEEDPQREGLLETPKRVATMYTELFSGYDAPVFDYLSKVFVSDYDGVVAEKDIPFYSTCEHHMMPIVGKVHIGYLPAAGRVVGLSKLCRVVEAYSRRLQIQERMTQQIADALNISELQPKGVIVVVSAEHFCMALRGVKKWGVQTITSAVRGEFLEDPALRAEFFGLIRG